MGFDKKLSAQRVAEQLKKNGVKRAELAEYLGMNAANTISYWVSQKENYRQPTLEQFVGMAEYFGVSVDYLLGVTDSPGRRPTLADELGLSKSATDKLAAVAHDPERAVVFRAMLESPAFYELVSNVLFAQKLTKLMEG